MHLFPRPRLLAPLLCLAVPIGAIATMAPRLSLEEMVQGSERIVHGRCVRTWSAWDAARQFIWTHSEIEILDPLKGGPLRTVVVSEPGGVVDGIGMSVEGAPRYPTGEEMVLFLYRTPVGYWRARGMGQGRFNIWNDAQGVRRVRGGASGVALVETAVAAQPGTDLRLLEGSRLDELKTRGRAMLARPAGGPR
jgi:hypothetical protein